jgi:hypothetical protein
MTLCTEVALRKTVEDYCQARARIVALCEGAARAMSEADDLMRANGTYGLPCDSTPRMHCEDAVRQIDARLWRAVFDRTGLTQLMDDEAVKRFLADLDTNAPAFTEDNIRATVLTMWQTAEEMFGRGCYNVFRRLDRHYRTNQGQAFEIGEKAVLRRLFESDWNGGLRVQYSSRHWLNDIDRCVLTVAGKAFVPHALEAAINAAFAKGASRVFENGYLQIKGFANGNAHLRFKRRDVLEQLNRVIAAYADNRGLPDARGQAACGVRLSGLQGVRRWS